VFFGLLWKIRWRTEGDSNPRYAMNVYTLSRRAPSTTRPPVLIDHKLKVAITHWPEIAKAKSAILTEIGQPCLIGPCPPAGPSSRHSWQSYRPSASPRHRRADV